MVDQRERKNDRNCVESVRNMFSLLSGCITACRTRPSVKVLMLGLDGSGKTVMLEQLKTLYKTGGVPVDKIPPTVGLNIGNINCNSYTVTLWDLGGTFGNEVVLHRLLSFALTQCVVICCCRASQPTRDLGTVL